MPKDQEILELAKKRFKICETHYSDLYTAARDNWDFVHGINQWDPKTAAYRKKVGNPVLTVNMLAPYLNQAVNDVKQARLAIRVVPVDSNSDVEVAELIAGIIRNIEKQSAARTVYGAAAMTAIGAGIGWIEVDTDYADYNSFDVEPKICRVIDFESIMIDPDDTSLSGQNAEYGFKKITISKDSFEENYPKATPSSFCSSGSSDDKDFLLVKYFWKEYTPDTLYEVSLIDGTKATHSSEDINKLEENGINFEILRERKVKKCKVMQAILSGTDVLEMEEFPSQYIPLVPVYGEEFFNNGKRWFRALTDQAKDPQRLYNYSKSIEAELMRSQPKPKFMGAVGSFDSYHDGWAEANISNNPTLEYDIVRDDVTGQIMPIPTIIQPSQVSPAIMQQSMAYKEDIRLSIGMPQSNMGERSNAVSGVAIRSQQVEGDNATFHFIDNFSASVAQVGRILSDCVIALYSDRQIARTLGSNNEEKIKFINQPIYKKGSEERVPRRGEQPNYIYDLSVGKYDIDIDTGASYSSKRQETADKLIELSRARPEILDIAGDILFEVLDVPMSKEIAKRIRSTMSPEILGDDPNLENLKKAQVTIQSLTGQIATYEAALADKQRNAEFEKLVQLKKLEQESVKIEIDAKKTAAEIEKMRAETVGFKVEAIQPIINEVASMSAQVSDITQALNTILDAKEQSENEESSAPIEQEQQPLTLQED